MPQPHIVEKGLSLAVNTDARFNSIAPIIAAGGKLTVSQVTESLTTCLTAAALQASSEARARDQYLVATSLLHAENWEAALLNTLHAAHEQPALYYDPRRNARKSGERATSPNEPLTIRFPRFTQELPEDQRQAVAALLADGRFEQVNSLIRGFKQMILQEASLTKAKMQSAIPSDMVFALTILEGTYNAPITAQNLSVIKQANALFQAIIDATCESTPDEHNRYSRQEQANITRLARTLYECSQIAESIKSQVAEGIKPQSGTKDVKMPSIGFLSSETAQIDVLLTLMLQLDSSAAQRTHQAEVLGKQEDTATTAQQMAKEAKKLQAILKKVAACKDQCIAGILAAHPDAFPYLIRRYGKANAGTGVVDAHMILHPSSQIHLWSMAEIIGNVSHGGND